MRRTLVALALMPLVASAATTPVLSGLYSVGELGLVQFSLESGKVVGRVKSSAQCVFERDTQVVSGAFEGGVFVGTVTLCQTGAGCALQKSYPMLGVAHDDAVAGWIRLETPCQSPALDGRSLFFRPATQEEKQKLASDASATSVAGKDKNDPKVQSDTAIKDGERLLSESKFTQAREKFRQAMELDESRWDAQNGYGSTEVKLGHPERSLEYFEKALALAVAHKEPATDVATIHYNRACAQVAMGDKKGAVSSLKIALKVGGVSNILDSIIVDSDLNPLRTDPDFKRMLVDAQAQQRKKK